MSKLYKSIIIRIIFLLFLIKQKEGAIYLPFKIISPDLSNDYSNPSFLIDYWNYTQITSELLIGNPPQKISVLFLSDIYELNLFENMCQIPTSFYYKEKSSSYNYIKNIKYTYNKILNCSIINESIYLSTDEKQTNKIIIEGFNIIYSDNKKEEYKSNNNIEYKYFPNTCLNIGFRPREGISFGYDLNFVDQIKHYKKNGISIIKDYDFTFKYTSEDKGYLIIGEKPHQFDSNNYHEEQFLLTGSKNRKFTSEWFLEFDNIYYTGIRMNDNSKYNLTFYSDSTVKFDLNFGLIEGTINYENNIKNIFFKYLIEKNICHSEEVNKEYRIYYCDKKSSINYIEKYFPVLKFCMKQLGFCFSFDYKDLFKEKDDKLYYLIYFNLNSYFSNRFTLGQILIKKYTLTFNYDTKMIGFYDKNIKIKTKNEQKNTGKGKKVELKVIIIFIVCLIVFVLLGFLLGKKIYDKARKKKANELIDDYEYESNDINSNTKKNILNVEMNSKYGLI